MIIQKNTNNIILNLYLEGGSNIAKYDFDRENKFNENIYFYKNKQIVLLLENNDYVEFRILVIQTIAYKTHIETYYYKNKLIHKSHHHHADLCDINGKFSQIIYLENKNLLICEKACGLFILTLLNLNNYNKQEIRINLNFIEDGSRKIEIVEYDYHKFAIIIMRKYSKSENKIYFLNFNYYQTKNVNLINLTDLENISLKENSFFLEMKTIARNKIIVMYENNLLEVYDCKNFTNILKFTSIVPFNKNFLYNNGNLLILKNNIVNDYTIRHCYHSNDEKFSYETNIISIVITNIHKINNYDINFFYKN